MHILLMLSISDNADVYVNSFQYDIKYSELTIGSLLYAYIVGNKEVLRCEIYFWRIPVVC